MLDGEPQNIVHLKLRKRFLNYNAEVSVLNKKLNWKGILGLGVMMTLLFSSFPASTAAAAVYTGLGHYVEGTHELNAWQSQSFQGQVSREWDSDLTFFKYHFNTQQGGQLANVSKIKQTTPGYGSVLIDNLPIYSIASVNGVFNNDSSAPANAYFFGLYGWNHTADVMWPAEDGWDDEWYIWFQGQFEPTWSDHEKLSEITVDGVVYDIYKKYMQTPGDWQWNAVARSKTWSPWVNIKPILKEFQNHGMSSRVMKVSWGMENLVAPMQGSLTLTNIHLPDVTGKALNGLTQRLINKNSGLSAAITGASTTSGSLAEQDAYTGASHQKWQMVSVSASYNLYRIVNLNSGLGLGIQGGSAVNGTQIIQSTIGASIPDDQKWYIEPYGNLYRLVNLATGKALDVSATGSDYTNLTAGANLMQWTPSHSSAQRWLIKAP